MSEVFSPSPLQQGLDAQGYSELDHLLKLLEDHARHQLGYPFTNNFDYSPLFRFLYYPINNAGDPFKPNVSWRGGHTRAFEVEVLAWFAERFHAPWQDTWGYVTNGGTEGNLYGLYLARERYPNGMVYHSQDTHYSVAKGLHMFRMQHTAVGSQSNGEIDYQVLHNNIRARRDIPPIILANIGTTMKEAIDGVARIRSILADLS